MEKTQKKRLKRYLLWGGMALLVALLTAMPLLAKSNTDADGPVASILSATVEKGTLESSLRGGGTVNADGAEDVTIPSGVKITEFLVKNGDYVTAGTPVATVDKVSVMTAITELNDTLDYLREELEDARDEKVASTITATAGGRVKKVFAQAGDSVQDVMLRDGALAILSLDGQMAVKLEKSLAITTGEAVTVTLADGETVEGRVESNLDGVVVITVEDEGYEVGQTVTVTQNGETFGQGSLYIHSAWKATAYSGTIETVYAKEERTVSSGATLFSLTDRDFEGELQRRANQHREYEELLQQLLTMYETGVLTAPCDGEISGVDRDSAHLLSTNEDGWVVTPLNTTEQTWSVVLLSNVSTVSETTLAPGCTQNENCPLTWQEHIEAGNNPSDCPSLCQECHENITVTSHGQNCITWCTKADSPEKCTAKKHYSDCIHSCTNGTLEQPCQGTKYHTQKCIQSCTHAQKEKQCTAGSHYLNCIEACDPASNDCKATTHKSDCIKCCTNSVDCPGNVHQSTCPCYGLTYTAVAGRVVRVENGVITYSYESAQPFEVIKDGSNYYVKFSSNEPQINTMVNGQGFVSSGGKNYNTGDIIFIITGTDSNNKAIITDYVYVYKSSSTGFDMSDMDMSGLTSGMMGSMDISSMIGGLSGFGSYSGSSAAETEDLFDLNGDTLLTVTPRDTVTLSISVDEHDIAKVQLGQKATVKIAALKGREYEAEVTAIAASGTNNGGSSKFAVELTFAMDEQLLSGMSASAVIPMESREGLRIPAAALQQEGTKTYVYTALDDKGQPTSPVEVETGLSDGEYVEVISGLEEGQQVYYSYYDTLELDTSAKADKYTFG